MVNYFPAFLNLETAELLRQAGPWGKVFLSRVLMVKIYNLRQSIVGEKHLKMLVEPKQGGPLLDAIAFNIDRITT